MTKISQKSIVLLLVIFAVALVTAGCPPETTTTERNDDVGVDSPSYEEASDSAKRPFKKEFLSVDLGISRDVIERGDILGPPTISEGPVSIYTESDVAEDKTVADLINETAAVNGAYLIAQYNDGLLSQISREWFEAGENGFKNGEHKALVSAFDGLEEVEFSEDSRVTLRHNAIREALDDEGTFGELNASGVLELLKGPDMVAGIGATGEDLVEQVFFEEEPDIDLSNILIGDAIVQLATNGNRSQLSVRLRDGQVVMAFVGHVIGDPSSSREQARGSVYTRFFWSTQEVLGQ